MKKVILLFSLIMSVLFIACSKSSSDTAKQLTPESVFTQEEVTFVNDFLLKVKNMKILEKNINQQNIDFTFESTDESEAKEKTKLVFEKKNTICLMHAYAFENSTWIKNKTTFDLTVGRLLGNYDTKDLYTVAEADSFRIKSVLVIDSIKNTDLKIYYGTSSIGNEIRYLEISLVKITGDIRNDIYSIQIFKNNGSFRALDSNGIIATEKSVDDILKNSKVKERLETIIKAIPPEPVFTQEEVNAAIERFKGVNIGETKNGNTLTKKIINQFNISFEVTSKLKDKNGVLIKDESGNEITVFNSSELIRKDNFYYWNDTETIQGKSKITISNFDLSALRLMETYKSEDLFTEEQFQIFGNFVNQISSNYTTSPIKFVYSDRNKKSLNLELCINDVPLYRFAIFKQNNIYILADQTGILIKDNSLKAILDNPLFKDRVNSIAKTL